MKLSLLSSLFWSDGLSAIEHAERMQRHFCRIGTSVQCWEPPIDVVETENAVMVHAALPGVPESAVVVGQGPEGITIAGVRPFPGPQSAYIHRLEIPYGRFERQVALPMQALELTSQNLGNGCLVLVFRKKESP